MSMTTETRKLLALRSSDQQTFMVEEAAVASQSVTIRHMIEDCDDSVVPLPNIRSSVLAKVIEYCKKHAAGQSDDAKDPEELKTFDAGFVDLDFDALFDLVLAANYLNIPGLLDITCQAIADSIKDLQPEKVRRIFNIENDFTQEEEDRLREENQWAYQI